MYLDPPQVFYTSLNGKKYDAIKAEILKRYVFSLENKVHPMDEIYSTKRLPLATFSAAHNG